jgi:hypothetical protein
MVRKVIISDSFLQLRVVHLTQQISELLVV